MDEFTRSATAKANGVDNTLDMTKTDDRNVIENLQHLCQTVLEPLREFVNAPVVVSSGYRCKELNSLVGGVRNSQHLTGEAADIQASPTEDKGLRTKVESPATFDLRPESCDLRQWFLFIQQHCRFDQLILETKGNRRWIHVSCCRDESRNRQTCLTKKAC